MVINIGAYGTIGFGGEYLPKPSATIMAYTGHTDFSRNDPPTSAVVGDRDGIAKASVMEARIRKMRANGIDAAIVIIPNVGHGFGRSVGTNAEGWIDTAVEFWKKASMNN
ncbi:MAG: dienelactone hydrolase family protein [Deltaproteobacteria bacterium]|jgi:pimeloyl-ACP methyl ester carboxylesterase|nr:dienelactone hydrolase family protein [Deltaproteobacteria bacterium]